MNEAAVRLKLAQHFPYYAQECLKVRTKTEGIQPLILNRSQIYLHNLLRDQIQKHGHIRVLLLKARQLGMSTYIQARFFHRVTHGFGLRAFILTHHNDATANLFGMAKRFQEKAPKYVLPDIGASSSRELAFPDLDSGYKVGTAGTVGVGRSDTIQLFHGSEVAFWPNAEEHAAGVLQAVPSAPGTEVFLESTANGLGGYFHEQWQEAERGENDFLPVFLPWFWDPLYQAPTDEFEMTKEEEEYKGLYDLSLEQIVWRRNKTRELKSEWKFKQEYPATAEEAFQVSGQQTLISSETVVRARHTEVREPIGALIIGVDPARFGDDSTGIIRRRGRLAYGLETKKGLSTYETAGVVKEIIETEHPDKVFVDVGGLGAGVVDTLKGWGFEKVQGVNFGSSPLDAAHYYNLRAEMWCKVRDWLLEPPVQIPDDNALHGDLCAPQFKYTANQATQLEKKEDMRKRGLKSPDRGDALALTFAYPVRMPSEKKRHKRQRYQAKRTGATWMAS